MSELYSFSQRSSGRDLTAVRRPAKVAPAQAVETPPDLDALRKAELVALAEERGVDTSGTKADIAARLEGSDA